MTPEQKLKSQEKLFELEEKLTLERNRPPREATDAEKAGVFWGGASRWSLAAFGLCVILFVPYLYLESPWFFPIFLPYFLLGLWGPSRLPSGLAIACGYVAFVIWWYGLVLVDQSGASGDSVRSIGLLAIASGTAISGLVGGILGCRRARNAERYARVGPVLRERNKLRDAIKRARSKDLADIKSLPDMRRSLDSQMKDIRSMANRTRSNLEDAKGCFTERRFRPFWNAVDRTSLGLDRCSKALRRLKSDLRNYNAVDFTFFPDLKGDFAPLSPTLPSVFSIQWDLDDLRVRAQGDYEFASIYEMRKTNERITDLSWEIDDLSSQVGGEFEVITDRLEALDGDVGAVSDAVAQLEGRVSTDASEVRERLHETGEKMDRVDRNVKEEIGNVEEKIGRVSTDASEVRERLHETGEKMDRVDRNVEEIMERWRARQRE